MEKRLLSLGLMLLLFSSLIPISMGYDAKTTGVNGQLANNGNTLYVDGSGPDNYTNIQGAIDDAFDGDTIFV